MYSIIGTLMEPMSFVIGLCVGAVIATILYSIATYLDYRSMVDNAKSRIYEEYDWEEIWFRNSFWDREKLMEIVLPEVK